MTAIDAQKELLKTRKQVLAVSMTIAATKAVEVNVGWGQFLTIARNAWERETDKISNSL